MSDSARDGWLQLTEVSLIDRVAKEPTRCIGFIPLGATGRRVQALLQSGVGLDATAREIESGPDGDVFAIHAKRTNPAVCLLYRQPRPHEAEPELLGGYVRSDERLPIRHPADPRMRALAELVKRAFEPGE